MLHNVLLAHVRCLCSGLQTRVKRLTVPRLMRMLPTTLMAAPMTHVAAPIVAEATQIAAPDQPGISAACVSAPVLHHSACTLFLMPQQPSMPFEERMSRCQECQRVQLCNFGALPLLSRRVFGQHTAGTMLSL